MLELLKIVKSHKPEKKYDAYFVRNGRQKVISFGSAGMEDYTMHHDSERQRRYIARHHANENWTSPATAGALSRYVLWSATSLRQGIANYKRRFHL
jgi:hypothetical protein